MSKVSDTKGINTGGMRVWRAARARLRLRLCGWRAAGARKEPPRCVTRAGQAPRAVRALPAATSFLAKNIDIRFVRGRLASHSRLCTADIARDPDQVQDAPVRPCAHHQPANTHALLIHHIVDSHTLPLTYVGPVVACAFKQGSRFHRKEVRLPFSHTLILDASN
ncbi:jg14395 [Pararge aegeria aegeria]|uniref:Jg14395 protein n=1 Tax=Pararge aegeria aegeria TaxID=348720 RepID=A0A8S4RZ48_9NEOP|nr:jg14395 [Pararge aegeria aegeria]